MRQDFESILNEPLPERFTALIRTLREEETRRAVADKSGA
ncbi:NepR family anti-sigma factor [Hyphomonas sp. NPDC076900]